MTISLAKNHAALKALEWVNHQLKQYGKVLPVEKFDGFNKSFNQLTEDASYSAIMDEETANAAFVLKTAVEKAVQVGRVNQIARLVGSKIDRWSRSRYGGEFGKTEMSSQADAWIEKNLSNLGHYEIEAWIRQGWELLKGALDTPWGKCPGLPGAECGQALKPILMTDKQGLEKWVKVPLCTACHHKLPKKVVKVVKKSTEPRFDAASAQGRVSGPGWSSTGKKKRKVGSAKKRGQGRTTAQAKRAVEDGGKKKEKKDKKAIRRGED